MSDGAADIPAEKLPRHIAFIMDGNGRWARSKGLLRIRGHEEGATALRRITRYCRSIGISEVTFYALSTENYLRRPSSEIRVLMRLLKSYLTSERPELLENGIRLRGIGRLDALPPDVLEELRETERLTAGHRAMVLRLALNYGSRHEILDAVRRLGADILAGRLTSDDLAGMDERRFSSYLYDPEMSDPDLLIRTAGELRLSNFLLWQCSYTEIWVTDRLWPEFDVGVLQEALRAFASRERKYGAIDSGGVEARPGAGASARTGEGRK